MTTINGLISLSHLYRLQNRYINMAKYGKAQGHVLMFHHVTDSPVDTIPECVCTVSDFNKILDSYENDGYIFVDIDTCIGLLNDDKACKFVVITFDDIPDDVYVNAYPILKARHIPFTVFIASDLVDTKDYITSNHLLNLASDALCTVGSHTITHPHLGKVEDCHYEIYQSKVDLEDLLHRQINHFAYPYGSVTAVPERAINEVRDAGYTTAFCTIKGPMSREALQSPFYLPRTIATHKIVEFKKDSLLRSIIRKMFK